MTASFYGKLNCFAPSVRNTSDKVHRMQSMNTNETKVERKRSEIVEGRQRKSTVAESPEERRDIVYSKNSIYDEYSIVKELGRGAFSRVYKGVSKSTGERCAIKVMATCKDDEEMFGVIKNEVEVMRVIKEELPEHKEYLCQIEQVIWEKDRTCIVMEFLQGGELFDRIVERRHYTERDAAKIMKKLVQAVHALHQKGIVHRDLKPENLVFKSDDENSDDIKVMDFGLALRQGQEDPHQSVDIVGSPGYVAPEVLISKTYCPANDVWSLGVILYILLTGRAPFRGRTQEEQMENIKAANYSLKGNRWEGISRSAKDLVSKLLVLDIQERITLEEVANHPWLLGSNLYRATKNLGGALSNMRKFNDTRKLGAAAQRMVGNATAELRDKLMGLLEKGTVRTAGLTITDIANILNALRGLGDQRYLTKDQFVDLFAELGLSELPVEDIFDTVAVHSLSVGMGKTKKKIEPLRLDREYSGDAEKEPDEPFVMVDHLIVGISIIVAKESRERVIQYLFNYLSEKDETKGKGKGEGKGVSANSFAKILQVMSSYEKPSKDSPDRKKHLAANVSAIFGEGGAQDTSTITYEQFKYGIVEFGDDVLQDFVFAPAQALMTRVQKFDRGIVTQQKSVRRFQAYVGRMFQYSTGVNSKYLSTNKDAEGSQTSLKSRPADEQDEE